MFWRDIAIYITPKPPKNSMFLRDIAIYIMPNFSLVHLISFTNELLWAHQLNF
jgi:hypothetical protein